MIINNRYLNALILTELMLCGLALYFVPLQCPTFNYDDSISIENNESIKTLDLPRIFSAFNTRFLTGLSFALNYRFSGLHPLGYRMTDLLIHGLNAFLVFLLIRSTLSLYLKDKPFSFNRLTSAAVFGALLFLCHPIQTETVNFITQRFTLMGTFFYLLTLYFYIQYRCRSKKRFLSVAIGSALASVFCKEFVVTLPFMLALYEFYFLGPHASSEKFWRRCRRLSPFFVIVLIVPVLLLKTPSDAIGVASIADSKSGHMDITKARGSIGRQPYFLTELNVLRTYVRLLIVPINQNLDYDYPISYRLDIRTFLSAVFLLCLLALAAAAFRTRRIVSFGILWFFIALSVESSIIPIGHVIAEYRLYLAFIGFVFIIMILIYSRDTKLLRLNIMAAVILAVFSVLTWQRNQTWKDALTLWTDTIRKSPHKARPYCNLADFYANQGQLNEAIFYYDKSIELNPFNADAFYNRGLAYQNKSDLARAFSDYDKTLTINPGYVMAFNNRGILEQNMGRPDLALEDYNQAITLNPHCSMALNNRGLIYYNQGKLSQALSDFDQAITINPEYAAAYFNRALVDFKLKKNHDFDSDMREAQKLGIVVKPEFFNALQVLDKGR